MKKVGKIIVAVLLVVSLTWSAVSTFLLYRSRHIPAHIIPIITQADNGSFVGQMRMPKMWETVYLHKTEDFVDLEFLGLEKGKFNSFLDETYDEVTIKATLREEVVKDEYFNNFWILHYCPEDGFWYAVYYMIYSQLDSLPVSGEVIEGYHIPPDVLEEPGLYAIGLYGLGTCSFEVE